ncbi:MAG: polysaccharide deacetylase family protein [Rhizobiales bacterium]|nr:polysaccharide deacetylase family protein [Hyphomicrobiales bacterium]
MFDFTLTFDNGPDEETTPAVLASLAARGMTSTFFVIGRKLMDPALRRLAERAHAEGHFIGNHTFTHSAPLGTMTGEAAEREIADTQAALGGLAHADRFFRPMGGGGHIDRRLLNAQASRYLQRERFTCVLWNAIPEDWKDPEHWAERALAQCRAQPWSLMVLHDLPTGAMRHLDRFLDAARDAGARFRQDFPPDCLPVVRGQASMPLAPYVADAA